jgi:hypothetical protein
MKDRYSLIVGLIFLVLVAVATLNTLGGDGDGGILGLDRREARWPLPEFAVPAATGQLEGDADANIAQDDCESSRVPCPDNERRLPACRIEVPGAIRVCDFFGRPLVLSFWFSKGEEGDCIEQQDVVSEVAADYRGRVGFLSLNVRNDRDTVRDLVRERGWRMQVGYDRDGAVASLSGIGLCPTFAYVYPGGTLQDASIGRLTADQLSTRVERLLAATREAEG